MDFYISPPPYFLHVLMRDGVFLDTYEYTDMVLYLYIWWSMWGVSVTNYSLCTCISKWWCDGGKKQLHGEPDAQDNESFCRQTLNTCS